MTLPCQAIERGKPCLLDAAHATMFPGQPVLVCERHRYWWGPYDHEEPDASRLPPALREAWARLLQQRAEDLRSSATVLRRRAKRMQAMAKRAREAGG